MFNITALTGIQDGNLILFFEIVVILIATIILAKIISMVLGRSFRKMSKNIKIDQTQFVVLQRLVVFAIYIIGVVVAAMMIPGFSALGVSLLASAGVVAIVVGFAAQQTFSNIISGIFIAIFKPFSVGDKVTIKDEYGTVEDITLRHTIVKTWKNERVVIPNSKISEEYITNYSMKDSKILGTVDIGISYDSNIDKARKIMLEEAEKHPDVMKEIRGDDSEFLRRDEVMKIRLTDLTDFAQNMRLYFWAKDKPTSVRTKFELTEAIKKRFDKEGIEVPFPYRTIVYKRDMEKESKKIRKK
ncbi:MAG: mechanosensitive ion channel [Candidatus Aenigmarchaeota archaeon]|nr:mechanosensitive ion channel [Candidatus Aenigmarchaeota archaeon]